MELDPISAHEQIVKKIVDPLLRRLACGPRRRSVLRIPKLERVDVLDDEAVPLSTRQRDRSHAFERVICTYNVFA